MKKLLLIPLLVLLTACGDSRPLDQRDYTMQKLQNIPELKDCIYLRLDNGNIKVIRCPNSSTTTQWSTGGKNQSTHRVTLVD